MTIALILTELQVLLIVIQKLSKIVIQKDHTFANTQRLWDGQPEPFWSAHAAPSREGRTTQLGCPPLLCSPLSPSAPAQTLVPLSRMPLLCIDLC